MRVEVRCDAGAGQGFAADARRRVAVALSGHAPRVDRVKVSAEAGEDAQVLCRLEVLGLRAWRVIVEEVDADPRQALDRAASRAAIGVGHTLERMQLSRVHGPLPWPSTRAS